MAGENKKEPEELGEVVDNVTPKATDAEEKKETKKKKRGILSRIWNGVFGSHGDDFEKRLQHISKEEAAVLARMKKRTLNWSRTARNIIVLSVLFELIAVAYAIMTTRSVDLDWKMRALRVLPMFLLPGLSSMMYSALASFTRMRDRKDQKNLERLRSERKAKIDELKERTNYYTTQQLIQRYDPDPAAKAAAATVLATKLGAESGLKVFVGDEPALDPQPTGKSNGVDYVQSSGLRKRNQSGTRSPDSTLSHYSDEMHQDMVTEGAEISKQSQMVVEHRDPTGPNAQDGGWIARIAALLVGEDPSQSYALICGNCHMHNGLARKEDFPFITYYCPHCHALNRPKNMEGQALSGSSTPSMASSTTLMDRNNNASGPTHEKSVYQDNPASEKAPESGNSPTATVESEKKASGEPDS